MHTPGPWRDGGCGRIILNGSNCYLVNEIWNEQGGYNPDDVRLMAAAPELLAALRLLRDPDGDGQWPCYCDDPHFDGGMCENCVASKAIAKAEGTNGENRRVD